MYAQLAPVAHDQRVARQSVDIKQLAQFNAQISDQPRDVGGADFGVGDFGDDRVL